MTDNVHGQSMSIKRTIDEAYLIAERDGFALLDTNIDESRLKAPLIMTVAARLSALKDGYAIIIMPVASIV